MTKIALIAAIAENKVIGKDHQLPWHLPADLKHFKKLTLGHTVLMGRKTYESIGQALPERMNLILTKNPDYQSPDCTVVNSLEDAFLHAKENEQLFVIGGSEIYRLTLPFAEKMYLTLINTDIEGDTFFPEWNKDEWEEVSREDFSADEKNEYDYSFVVLNKIVL